MFATITKIDLLAIIKAIHNINIKPATLAVIFISSKTTETTKSNIGVKIPNPIIGKIFLVAKLVAFSLN